MPAPVMGFYVQETKAPAGYYGDWADEGAGKTAGSNVNKVKYGFQRYRPSADAIPEASVSSRVTNSSFL